jgi:hypothetical protein
MEGVLVHEHRSFAGTAASIDNVVWTTLKMGDKNWSVLKMVGQTPEEGEQISLKRW